ncbi:conserved hypothetical protein [Novosphingobium sp. 9U]|nr:conserved hypothetical protein [Novosphingobium sp. 9U]
MCAAKTVTASLRDLLHDCIGSEATHQGDRLREAMELLGLGDRRTTVQAMLACEAYESAAMAVLGQRGFLVSRGSTGTCLASVQLDDGDDITAEAATPALALLAAHIAALLAEAVAAKPDAPLQSDASARLH